MRRHFAAALGVTLAIASPAVAEGFLKVRDKAIVDERGEEVILRGMGLGGWMLQEGYMLQLGELGQQHVIRRRIAELIGEARTIGVYKAWLDNHTTKADIDAMAAWGFNSVRLPLHYDLLTLPIDQEPVKGQDTWKEDGFRRIDELLAWSKANGLYLILDLHAAPGGQGNDLPISDRDPDKPSLWEDAENRRKTVALWRKLAQRYADEPMVGAYDIINEPNWGFTDPADRNGCKETGNAPLRQLMMEITAAIREVDKRHMVIIEGNCWGNNYKGVMPPWDDNLVVSFHKYWNYNTDAELKGPLEIRDMHNVPVWLGETGENSNVWFRDAVRLVERHRIGWAMWPLKKIGFNNPLEIRPNPGYAALVAYLTGKGPKPDPDAAYRTLMTLASKDVRFENNLVHKDVVDAMLRQPHDEAPRPFAAHRIKASGGMVRAVDYDLGPAGVAYQDTDLANYHTSTGKERTPWNRGRTVRNDGVDIHEDQRVGAHVGDIEAGEWLRYTVTVDEPGAYVVSVRASGPGTIAYTVNGSPASTATTLADGWATTQLGRAELQKGANVLTVRFPAAGAKLASIRIKPN